LRLDREEGREWPFLLVGVDPGYLFHSIVGEFYRECGHGGVLPVTVLFVFSV
jgi:hypothetical protein